MTWGTIILPVLLSFHLPEVVMIFLIVYTALWFLRSLEFSYFLIKTYFISKHYNTLSWHHYLSLWDDREQLREAIVSAKDQKQKKFLEQLEQKKSQHIKMNTDLRSSDIFHVIILAHYKEDLSIIQGSIEHVIHSRYDLKKIIIILAGEERAKEQCEKNAQELKALYKDTFAGFYTSLHPKDIPGEVKGKGANITYAAKKLMPSILEEHKLDPSHVLVTTLDADNCVHASYFANLTLHYLMQEDREYKSYQPLPLFYNNIWEVPIFNRIIAFSNSFWHMIESGRPDRLRNFSSHAQPLAGLLKTDYWSTKTIVEDGHQYWRSYFAFEGRYEVIPLFMPIYQDAVQNVTYTTTLIAQYKQLRRWAWGSSDIPFFLIESEKHADKIPFFNRFMHFIRLLEGHYMWATVPITITLGNVIPRMINPAFGETNMAYNMGMVLSQFFQLAFFGLIVTAWISLLIAPKKPKTDSKIKYLWLTISSILQWFLLPFTTIVFGSLPAIESQTRLMLGQSLDFQVTEKIRSRKNISHH